MSRAIITGSNGQDGFYLEQILRHYRVEPIPIPSSQGFDFGNRFIIQDLVDSVRPEYIFHLAAKSSIDHQFAVPNHELIADGSFNLLDAALRFAPECRVFLAGSAYQFLNNGKPIHETCPWDTDSVYCAARGYSNLLARVYKSKGLRAYFGYFFHHESPRRGKHHISQRIAEAARNRSEIAIGDVSVVKEWTWAGDAMGAVWSLVNQDRVFEANIGSGVGHSIAEFAEACFAVEGLDWRKYVKTDPDFRAPYQSLTCDPTRIFSTGWRPTKSLQYVAESMVDLSMKS